MDSNGARHLRSARWPRLFYTRIISSLLLAIAATTIANATVERKGSPDQIGSLRDFDPQDVRHAGTSSIFPSSLTWPTIWLASRIILTCAFIEGIRSLWAHRLAGDRNHSSTGAVRSERGGPLTQGMLGSRSSNFGKFTSALPPNIPFSCCILISFLADPHDTDPGLLKKHSVFQSYATSVATYPSVRTFHRPHPQADKLPSRPTPLPLLVFVHGLGGSLAQFKAVLTSLVDVAPCLGIDLPGCGRSAFSPSTWSAYTCNALAELICVIIEEHTTPDQEYVLIGHSLGCSLSALVAASFLAKEGRDSSRILGLIGICPSAEPPSEHKIKVIKALLYLPSPIFNIWRIWDRRGGPHSESVARFVGRDADIEVKKLQEKFNAQSRTPVYRRMAWGLLPRNDGSSGMAGLDIWEKLKVPVFLVGGDADVITKVDGIAKIARALGRTDHTPPRDITSDVLSDGCVGSEDGKPDDLVSPADKVARASSSKSNTETTVLCMEQIPETSQQNGSLQYTHRRQVLKTTILPAPASHGLLYDPTTSRILSGLIQTFLCEHIDTRLSLGWQLQHLSTEGKWDVKNLAKWRAVNPVSEPVAGIFRAMKTLREVDEVHSPENFAEKWRGKIKAVIDISHESPVYDPKGLDDRGIEYHKFPTVSKIPPTEEETRDFAHLVDHLRSQPKSLTNTPSATAAAPPPLSSPLAQDKPLIGVHCHYGFNRTGFFICSYLIEKEGCPVQEAVDTFAKARPPGIRHAHFLDELFVRYCVGLKRVPTMEM